MVLSELAPSAYLPADVPWVGSERIGRGSTMDCVACSSATVTERPERTARGYRRFRCRKCGKQFNERSAGALNRIQYPSDVVALVVLWRLRYRLTLRDLAEMFLQRGIVFSHEAVRGWEAKLAPVLADKLRQRRHGKGGARSRRWHVDETYLKVGGRWAYLYRAIDRDGNLIDTMLNEHRDMAAAQAFFRSAKSATGQVPDQVTTDGHGSYPRAIRSTLGRRVVHRSSAYKNNRLEQDHRGVKGRIRCMRGFKSFDAAERFCRSYDELRNFLRLRNRHNQHVPADRRRLLHLRRATAVLAILDAA
jgi:putative transposase